MKKMPLPYCDKRKAPIDTLVLHCLAFDVENGLKTLHDSHVSSHYMIDLDGTIYQLVDEEKRAWHAGKSFWRGREELNHHSIGIEVCNLTLGQSAYDKRQVFALIRLCQQIIRRYHIKPQNVIGHSDIAPTRKPDPGKSFPWEYLSRHGVGLWYKLKDAGKETEDNEAKLLAAIGYDVSNLAAAKWAFCRHFMPDAVPTDENIINLIEKPYPLAISVDEENFKQILKAVAWRYQKSR